MRRYVPRKNYAKLLPETIKEARSGDTIIVCTEAMRDLGGIAHERMCPEKDLTFLTEIEDQAWAVKLAKGDTPCP